MNFPMYHPTPFLVGLTPKAFAWPLKWLKERKVSARSALAPRPISLVKALHAAALCAQQKTESSAF